MTTELILYLEPSAQSSLCTQTRSFFHASRSQPFARNEALRYPVHCTMLGFFDKPSSASSSPSGVDSLKEYLDRSIAQIQHQLSLQPFVPGPQAQQKQHQEHQEQKKPAVLIQGFVRPGPETLLISLLPSDELLALVASLTAHFPELGLRPKRINHLSLCYWDESEMVRRGSLSDLEKKQRQEWTDYAQTLAWEAIPMLRTDPIPQPHAEQGQEQRQQPSQHFLNESWDIVLYEIHGRDKSNDLPYPLQELKRWTL